MIAQLLRLALHQRFLSILLGIVLVGVGESQELMQRAGVRQSRPRQAAAWITEKIAELKLRLDDPTDGSLRLLESLEALSLGIEGKHALWDALASAAAAAPALQETDYTGLKQRAEDQRRRVETHRLDAAKGALASVSVAE